MSINGYLSAVLGPVIDIQCNPTSYKAERFTMRQLGLSFTLQACVYDACIVLRPSTHFRNSTRISNPSIAAYLQALPFNDSVLMAAVSSLPCSLPLKSHLVKHIMDEADASSEEALYGFASLFMQCKAYSNFCFAEIHQLCFGGRYRAVALASTDGLSTSNSPALLTFQPIYVPCGSVTLGRIFNVLGATMDGWFQLDNHGLASQYGTLDSTVQPLSLIHI